MSKAINDYQRIIGQLERLREHCSDMAKGGEEIWKEDESALQKSMDIIHDYESIVASYNRMVEHYETANMTIKRQTGVYVCPECGKRVYIGHSYCHWCGKKVCWDKEAYESRNNSR